MNYVQSFISNIAFPTSLDELSNISACFNIEMLLGVIPEGHNPEMGLRETEWTAPKWCKRGDIVFFMHSKTANTKISHLKTELERHRGEYSDDEYWYLLGCLFRAKALWNEYGGKIFAVARVSNTAFYDNEFNNSDYHWGSKIFAPMDSIFVLEKPIDISKFNDHIMVSRQSSITPVFGKEFEYLKQLILRNNKRVEQYLIEASAEPLPLSRLTKENWLEVTNRHRRSFFLEIQFRTFYVNRLLAVLGDTTRIYRECVCIKTNEPNCFVDNVILLDGKYLPVEVKLSVSSEKDIIGQVSKYCALDDLLIEKKRSVVKKTWPDVALVIDTDSAYLYDHKKCFLTPIYHLDDIKVEGDIYHFREVILNMLSGR
ncbi:MAG: hypothetical protein IJ048_07395 [Clostridia bacterium]|nr:hypothetical protein [Clostridia bacterium]